VKQVAIYAQISTLKVNIVEYTHFPLLLSITLHVKVISNRLPLLLCISFQCVSFQTGCLFGFSITLLVGLGANILPSSI